METAVVADYYNACVATCHGHTWVANQLEGRNGTLVSASADWAEAQAQLQQPHEDGMLDVSVQEEKV